MFTLPFLYTLGVCAGLAVGALLIAGAAALIVLGYGVLNDRINVLAAEEAAKRKNR